MPANVAAVLEPLGEARVVLESVAVQARLRGLLSETQVTQTYRNLEDDNIEAVYTFPLPLDAVLLELELTLNGRTLQGQVQAKARAEESYEDAIDEGDSAVLLQAAGPGLYSLNLGNLMPGETAVVRFRYAQLHRWQGDSLRFHLPTTIAPRYGDPVAAGLGPHQVPEHVLTADHGFTLSVTLEGSHADADFECPSHTVAVATVDAGREIRLSGGAAIMDRDFVLVLRESGTMPEGLWARDEEGVVALASFHPRFPADTPRPPRRVTLVVDCSGSMGGDSIAQARAALKEILALLEPEDRFNLIAFGSSHRALFPEPVMADAEHIRDATRFVGQLDASMGGTEIGAALDAAYQGGPGDVLLITDGEVWNDTDVVGRAERSGKRIFTVGVGSSVAEAFVRELAERTGGACELVSPREDMAERIVRHFCRMDQPRAERAGVEWSAAARPQVPESIDAVYGGDTLHLLAWLAEPPSDHATLTLTLEGGRELREQVAFTPNAGTDQEDADVLPRVAARRRLRDLQQDEATDLAVRYQLVTEHTSCVLVYAREVDAKAEKVPALRKVPQVLAAGWGGIGSTTARKSRLAAPEAADFDMCLSMDRPAAYRKARAAAPYGSVAGEPESSRQDADRSLDYLDIPDFLRRDAGSFEESAPDDERSSPPRGKASADGSRIPPGGTEISMEDVPEYLRRAAGLNDEKSIRGKPSALSAAELVRVVSALSARYPDGKAAVLELRTLGDLASLGFGTDAIEGLEDLLDDDCSEEQLVATVLSVLASSPAGKHLSRNARRLIRRAERARAPSDALVKGVSRYLLGAEPKGLLAKWFGS